MSSRLLKFLCLGPFFSFASVIAFCGPPFKTDDPQPVDFRHWELYVASQWGHDRDGLSGTAPHLEINNGAWPDLQLHMIVPLSYVHPQSGPPQYGVGDVELGVKYRFIEESDSRPQIGTFPQVELPSGDNARGLGSGAVQIFFPLWLQKSWGPWTTYGGAGYWHTLGHSEKDTWYAGWEVQRDLSPGITIGAEIFHETAASEGTEAETGFKVGAIINFTEEHHLLVSAGRDVHGQNLFSMYLSYQWTFGPG